MPKFHFYPVEQMSVITNKTSEVHAELRALNQVFATVRYLPDGRIKAANHRFLRITGYELPDLIGQQETMFLSKSYQRTEQNAIWEDLRAGKIVEKRSLCITNGGHEIWLHSRYVPLQNDGGHITEIVQIVEDVTEQQTREADERSQIIAINKTQAVAHFSLNGVILSANEIFLNAMGYEEQEILGQHHSIFIQEEERESTEYKAFWKELSSGAHRVGECRRINKDGKEVWLQAVYSPVLDPAGRPTKVVKYATDITQQKLRQADYSWQITAIHKSNLVITFDMYGTILDANDLFLEATGYTENEICGRHHRIFVEPSYAHSGEYAAFWQDLRKGHHRSGQYRRIGKDGKEVWLQATYNPIFDTNGQPVKVVKYASVVTDERLLQADNQGQIAAIHNAQCVISFELDGTIIDANENFLDATGYRYSDVRGMHHSMFVEEEYVKTEDYQSFWKKLSEGNHCAGEYRRICKDGREIWLQATYNPILDMNGKPFKIVKYATDVTADKMMHADHVGQINAIHRSQGVIVFNLDGTVAEANENFLSMFGYEANELDGKHHATLVEKEFAASREYVEFWDLLRTGAYHSGMYKRLGKDGREIWIQASYNPVLDLDGKPVKVIKYATDVSSNVALAEAFEDARRQANHDAATSLPNRAKLSSFMNACLGGPEASMVVFYIDLDRFKPVNDTYGHHVGDRVLGEVADRMRRALKDDQLVARIGGDEFVIAAPGMTMDEIEPFCKNLYKSVTQPIRHDGGEVSIGMSIGIAIAPTDATTPDELLRMADTALYRSKENGRGHYSFFASDMNEKISTQRQLAEDMRHSLTAGDFYLEYQPRFDTRQRTIRSVEALVRWAHPEHGRINPMDFISIAEQNGLIVPLGEWILRTACNAAAQWDSIGVSVNVSPIQFRDAGLVDKVKSCLLESGLPGHLLELEITEGVLLEDAERANEVLRDLKALGIKLAMDDFGTGYSSLSYLRNFPFDVIKIDRSFISDIDSSDSARSIIQAILGLGKALGLSVTAEGVETNEQLVMLTADQCNEVQGFLMARPLTTNQISELLNEIPQLKNKPSLDVLPKAS